MIKTVKELIEELQKYPQDMEVMTYPGERIQGVCKTKVYISLKEPDKVVVLID